jgi:hypothetical protein
MYPMKIPVWNGIKKTIGANNRVKAAEADYLQTHARYVAFAEQVQREVYELGEARIAAIQTLGKAVPVIGKAKMGIHDDFAYEISPEELVKIEQQSAQLAVLASGSVATGLTVGAVSAIGAYGVVGAIGTASTGTAIAALSGAAATNATLAALGGGALTAGGLGMVGGAAVLSGIFALPILAGLVIGAEVVGSRAEKKADGMIEAVTIQTAKIDHEMARLKSIRIRIRELITTTARLTDSLNNAMEIEKVNWLKTLASAIKRLFTRKQEPDQRIYEVALIAKSLSAIVDEPVVPQEQTK